uniref:Uncharacterized protein n=1 Tax=Aegilops tauschii subsp. strangulata TaxID=200361 RepID=A0A453K7I3_AEGTS
MDKTVRLWDTASKACLKKFSHSDYVTSIQFNPVDDRYFISGSLDAKVRLWSIPNRQVVDWTDVNEMVTAASYSPDGQSAIIGSHQGSCRFYKTADCKISPEAQIDVQSKKRKSQAKKITGFQYAPGNPSEVLVTSADSQIRVFDGVTMVQKFREHEQPDRGGLHLRRAVRGVRERGLARLHLEDHPERARRGGHRHRHEAQDVVHHPLLRELLLQGRLRRHPVDPLAVPARQPEVAPGRRVVQRRCVQHGEPRRQARREQERRAEQGDQERRAEQPRRAVATLGPARHAVIAARQQDRSQRPGQRQRVGLGGSHGDLERRDKGVPELRDALQDQRPGQSVLLIRPA